MEINSSVTNDGEYSWDIPSGLEPLTQYRIKITDVSNPTVYAYSDYFEIYSSSKQQIPGYHLVSLIGSITLVSIYLVKKKLKVK